MGEDLFERYFQNKIRCTGVLEVLSLLLLQRRLQDVRLNSRFLLLLFYVLHLLTIHVFQRLCSV